MLLISSMKATLLALIIVTYVGPSAGPPQDDEDYEAPDSAIPWNPGRNRLVEIQDVGNPRDTDLMLQPLENHDFSKSDENYNSCEDLHVDPKISSNGMLKDTNTDQYHTEDTAQDFLDALNYLSLFEKANDKNGNELDFKRMISFPWSKSRKGKTHEAVKNQYCRVSPPTTKRPGCHGSTTERRPPPTCPSKTTAPPRKCTPTPTPKPFPNRDQCNKSRQKPRIPHMKPKMAKVILKIIMDTKQHVLFALEILNHMENEVLTRSPDICQRQNTDLKPTVSNKCCPVPKKKSGNRPKFSQYNQHPRKSHSIMALARQKQAKHKENLAPIASEENWCPISASRATNRRGYKKYRNNGQKQQERLRMIPPGMVAILT